MGTKSYNNDINEVEVSLAIERLLIANYPQSWTPARVDLDSLPSGFFDLGSVEEDATTLSYNREKFSLETGLPRVIQYQAVTGISGTFECMLHSNHWRKAQYALGNFTPTASATAVTSLTSVTDQTHVTLATTSATLVQNQQIIIAAPNNEDNADVIETRIASKTDDGLDLELDPTPIATPTTSMNVYVYDYVRQAYGTSQIKHYVLLGVADFIDGEQVVHHIGKVTPSDEFSESFSPDDIGKIQLQFDAFGTSTAAYGDNDELIVAERFYFPSTG